LDTTYSRVDDGLTTEDLMEAAETFVDSTQYADERLSWEKEEDDEEEGEGSLSRSSSSPLSVSTIYTDKSGGVHNWWFCYRLLLSRAFTNCIRNGGNLLARLACNALIGSVGGLILFQVRIK